MLSRCPIQIRRAVSTVMATASRRTITSLRSQHANLFVQHQQQLFQNSSSISRQQILISSTRQFSSKGYNLELPALSPTMENGSVAQWHKKPGDRIAPGDLICDIQTDKASVGFDAQEECFLVAILVPANAGEIPVGTPIGIVVDSEDALAEAMQAHASGASVSAPSAPAAASAPAATPAPAATSTPTPTSTPSKPSTPSIAKPKGVEKLELPALSPTMENGSIAKWHKKVGDLIKPGDMICEIQTDKAVVSFDSQDEYYLAAIYVEAGGDATFPVGTAIGYTCEDESELPNAIAYAKAMMNAKAEDTTTPTPQATASTSTSTSTSTPSCSMNKTGSSGKYNHTLTFPPSVSMMLLNLGLDASSIQATGPKGRLIKDDVINAIANGTVQKSANTCSKTTKTTTTTTTKATTPTTPKSTTSTPVAGLTRRQLERRTYIDIPINAESTSIFTHMSSSKTNVPHTGFSIDVPIASALEFCSKYNISFESLVIRAAAKAFGILPESATTEYNGAIDTAVLSTTTRSGNNGIELSYPRVQVIKRANNTNMTLIDKKIAEITTFDSAAGPQQHNCPLLVTLLSSDTLKISFGLEVLPESCIAGITLGAKKIKTVIGVDNVDGTPEVIEYVTIAGAFDGAKLQSDEIAEYMQKVSQYVSSPASMIL